MCAIKDLKYFYWVQKDSVQRVASISSSRPREFLFASISIEDLKGLYFLYKAYRRPEGLIFATEDLKGFNLL